MNSREIKYDFLRSIACIAVILLHVSGSYWGVVTRDSAEFVIMTVYNALTRFAVPVFMMLSGAFMLDPEKEKDSKDSVKRFCKYILIFYIWSAFYAFQGIAFKFITGKEVTGELWANSWNRFLWGNGHMWFLFVLLGFYLLLPILRKLCESKKTVEYYLVLWAVVKYAMPALATIPGLAWITVWINQLDISMFMGFLGYFILGYYIRKYGFGKKIRVALYIGGLAGLFYSIVGTIGLSRIQEAYNETLLGPGTWNVCLLATAIFTFFANSKKASRSAVFVSRVARYSLVIYLVHPFFVEKLNMVGITTVSFHCLFSIPVLTVVVFAASYVVAAIINKIPYVNKLLL